MSGCDPLLDRHEKVVEPLAALGGDEDDGWDLAIGAAERALQTGRALVGRYEIDLVPDLDEPSRFLRIDA